MKRIFPLLPVLSRTQLGIDGTQIPDTTVLDKLPTHLLAAVYASALPFSHEDDHLCLLAVYEPPSISRIWKIAYLLLMEELHSPRLSVLQAGLLYLHKQVKSETGYSPADNTFIWSFMGSLVGLAHSLGLNLQCSLFGLPSPEKRLRRRLWWATYVEDKWLAMLFGRPPYIRSSEWDVDELTVDDFAVGARSSINFSAARSPFQDMASLSVIAEAVQENL